MDKILQVFAHWVLNQPNWKPVILSAIAVLTAANTVQIVKALVKKGE